MASNKRKLEPIIMKKHNLDDLVQGGERVLYAAICVIGSLIFLGLLLVSYLASLIPLI